MSSDSISISTVLADNNDDHLELVFSRLQLRHLHRIKSSKNINKHTNNI